MEKLQGLIVPISFLVIFYFLVIRPQQKREKQIMEMRNSLSVGDEILTVGGIYGKIVKLKEDTITIEVGSNKTRLDMTRWAVGNVIKKKNENKKEDDKNNDKDKE